MDKDSTFFEQGQTLIETIVAIFVLTTGLSAGLALAIYGFGSSSDLTERIAATGLAREGIEVVRRMRDSNWLAGSLVACPDIGSTQNCYPTWLNQTYDIRGLLFSPAVAYRIIFDPTSVGNKWTITPAAASDSFRLFLKNGGGITNDGSNATPLNFFRKIEIIQTSTASPYSATSPLLLVRSSVWWWGKNCPQISYLNSPSDTFCKIISEENLSNWKNY